MAAVAQKTEDSVEETDGMVLLARTATDRTSSNVGPLDLGEDAVQRPERRIAEAWEVAVFQVQEMTGQGREIRGVNEEATDDQDGLIVRQGWIAQCVEITGFVDEAGVQRRPPKKLWPPDGDHRVCRPRRAGNRCF